MTKDNSADNFESKAKISFEIICINNLLKTLTKYHHHAEAVLDFGFRMNMENICLEKLLIFI